ncbi:E3 ubiquitin-protein ligase UPL6, partial [Mucuna pruriens]
GANWAILRRNRISMFFSGDSSTRKRVDLGGRSSKERDRKNLLEQTRLERNRRLWLRRQNSAALTIQKCFRGRKIVRTEQSKLREKFLIIYGKNCQNLDRNAFGPDSDFLRQFLYFFNAENIDDFLILVQICRLLQQFVQESGDVVRLFAGMDYSSTCALVNYRVKQFVYTCIRAVHQNRLLDSKNLLSWKQQVKGIIRSQNVHRFLVNSTIPSRYLTEQDHESVNVRSCQHRSELKSIVKGDLMVEEYLARIQAIVEVMLLSHEAKIEKSKKAVLAELVSINVAQATPSQEPPVYESYDYN